MSSLTSTLGRPLETVRESGAATGRAVRTWALAHARELAWIVPVLTIGAVISFVGIGGSPQRIDDEGTYTAQAWAVLNLGELAHYTYWYDHPPVGWLQLAGYAQVTGAFARWDLAVLAMREASIVFTLVGALLLWLLARRVGLVRPAAAAAALVFLISPLAVQFHRTVYLDNIAVPWLLLAFLLASEKRRQLAAFTGAAIAFGVAVLTKETFLLALPFLAWVMIRTAQRETRRYTLSVAASVLVLIGASYLLLALVKGELLAGDDRVSLFDGIAFQLFDRDSSGSLFDPESLTLTTVSMWWQLDRVFIVAGLAAGVVGLCYRRLRPYAALIVAVSVFMLRPGGYLPVPYIIMLIPFAALLIAGVAQFAVAAVRSGPGMRRVAGGGMLAAFAVGAVLAVPGWVTQLRGFVLADLDAPMRDAQAWVETNVDRDERLIVDDAMWVDLVEAGWDRENVVWYYKLDTDPAVAAQSPNGWADSDYVITTDSMRTFPSAFPEVRQAIENSVVVAEFGEGDQAVQVRSIDTRGADASGEAMDAAAQTRGELGGALAENPALVLDDADRETLADGRVDARVAALLASLAGAGDVQVAGFPAVAGEDAADRPLRQVAITSFDGHPAVDEGTVAPAARDLLDQLEGAYAPDSVRVDGDELLVRYPVQIGTSVG